MQFPEMLNFVPERHMIDMVKLNENKFVDAINTKWANTKCPMCNENNWNLNDHLVAPVYLSESGDFQLRGDVMPLVAITCLNCGNVLFINPLVNNTLDSTKA